MDEHSGDSIPAGSGRSQDEKMDVVEVSNGRNEENKVYSEKSHVATKGSEDSSAEAPADTGAFCERVEDDKTKKGDRMTSSTRDGQNQADLRGADQRNKHSMKSLGKLGTMRLFEDGIWIDDDQDEMAQTISETATYMFPPKFTLRGVEEKVSNASCLLDADYSELFIAHFPDADWKEDLWAIEGSNPINESLDWYGHNDLPAHDMKRLQKAVVLSAAACETKIQPLTWNGFAKPFLSYFGRKLRQFIMFVQEDGAGLGPTDHEHEEAITILNGRHAIMLCWVAIDIAYGSKITFRDYLKKLCSEESTSYCDICEETGYPKHLLFSFYRAASLICPYMTANNSIGDVSTKRLLDTYLNDYTTISKLFETNATHAYRISDTTIQPSSSDTFQHQELSLPSILKSTDLQVIWCEDLSNHLFIGQKDEGNVLCLYWPCHTGMEFSQLTRISDILTNCLWVKAELLETCAILFTSSDDIRDDIKYYGKLETPDERYIVCHGSILQRSSTWLRMCFQERFFSRKRRIEDVFNNIGSGCDDLDVAAHFGEGHGKFRRCSTGRPSTRFEDYKVFGDRLRVLKAYMDLQQPKGIRQLWRDTRNKKEWYTFWAVIIIGGIGLIFAAASFAVSAAQTAATFQALQLQLNSPSQTSSTP